MKWTKENEDKLKELWKDKTDKELSEFFQTTEESIKAKRRRLRLIRKEKTVNNTKIYTYQEVKELFDKKGYTLLDTVYVNYTTKMKYICKQHPDYGIQQINLCDLLRGIGCFMCGREKTINSHKKNNDYWKEECKKRDFTFVESYSKNNHTYIKYICNKHKNVGVQEKFSGNLLKSTSCPHCKSHFYENMIGQILDMWNLKYTREKRFSDCKDKYTLPFDYYLDEYNIAIEYDGEFHHKSIRIGNKMSEQEANNRFAEVQRRDKIKTDYCKQNNIKLIRIPYWDQLFMDDILFDMFIKYGVFIEE
jgi:hypothetical protein